MSIKNKLVPSTLTLTIVKGKKKKIQKIQKIQAKLTKPILCDPDIKAYQEALHKCFVFVRIDNSEKNLAFICKKYIYKLLAENGLSNSKSKTYSNAANSIQKII